MMSHSTIALDPVLFRLGPLTIRWYGVPIGLAVATASPASAMRRRGLVPETLPALAVWGIMCGLVGVRASQMIERHDAYRRNPVTILDIARGRLGIFGAVFGGVLAIWLFVRPQHRSFAAPTDTLIPGLVLVRAIGRLGCVSDGDAWGVRISALRHGARPGALALLWRQGGHPLPPGVLFPTDLTPYAVGRFALTFVRQERVWFSGFQEARAIALPACVGAVFRPDRLLLRPQVAPAATRRSA